MIPSPANHTTHRSTSYFLFAIFSAFVPGCPLNIRVGENSPNLCPTIFSVTKTGMWRLPLWTPKVNPTISGEIVERRDQDLELGIVRAEGLIARWPDDVSLGEACHALTQAMAPPPRSDDVCVVALRFGA